MYSSTAIGLVAPERKFGSFSVNAQGPGNSVKFLDRLVVGLCARNGILGHPLQKSLRYRQFDECAEGASGEHAGPGTGQCTNRPGHLHSQALFALVVHQGSAQLVETLGGIFGK